MSAEIFDIASISNKRLGRKQNIGVIIQARMTSKRFPGKSMFKLFGTPVIGHVMERAKKLKLVNKVILAVPDTLESEPMLELAQSMGVDNFCGDENDVLGRYFAAASFFNLDTIIRITGDCPFINIDICDKVLDLYLWRKLDYCSNIYPVRSYPKGMDCEVFSMDTLHASNLLCSDQYDREHVTPYMQRENGIKKACLQQPVDRSYINYCIDYPEDIERVTKIVQGKMEHLFSDKKASQNVKA